MEFLHSEFDLPKSKNKTFSKCFNELISVSHDLQIATGYISSDSIMRLKRMIEVNQKPRLNLMVGMHYFDGITKSQYDASMLLNDFLVTRELGQVTVANAFKFHGKMYSFSKNGDPFGSIIGSSNLSNIMPNHLSFETDIYLNQEPIVSKIDNFIKTISSKISIPISSWEPVNFREQSKKQILSRLVKEYDENTLKLLREKATKTFFTIPIKTAEDAPLSGVNAFFGKGRKNKKTQYIDPRDWYEVEIIVPADIARHPEYPQPKSGQKKAVFTVITDDGWAFECQLGGDYRKNFRSNKNLLVLGIWIKTRLQDCGALKKGDPITRDTLKKYGRDNIELRATANKQTWLLDFSPKKKW